MSEQAVPIRVVDLDAAEARAVYAADAVVPRKALVDERVVGVSSS
jgi:hypothetical protein